MRSIVEYFERVQILIKELSRVEIERYEQDVQCQGLTPKVGPDA